MSWANGSSPVLVLWFEEKGGCRRFHGLLRQPFAEAVELLWLRASWMNLMCIYVHGTRSDGREA